jgi:hypothetical protein
MSSHWDIGHNSKQAPLTERFKTKPSVSTGNSLFLRADGNITLPLASALQ